ncbi:SusC/RagA family TonB-linked outer membrane protein [Maribellus comscasis]|uniref:SusC/RagA family TonB-linked outer membrane protein n=1 Tax=Maribellus comscasis TaxID=2681766 RepID=A0A6I6JV53_9BACT|nr:TonB-dependent receptor [Maribellus comscasis]QGY45149.1 SusC/RagA family TonB-linked outer membrane protein [Maribellus comscasis]
MKKNIEKLCSFFKKHRRRIYVCISATFVMMLFLAVAENTRAGTSPESVKLDLKMKKVSLKEVFKTITDKSKYTFVYNNNFVNDNQQVTIVLKDAGVEEILDKILLPQDLDYKIVDNQIIVFSAEEKLNKKPEVKTNAQQISVSGKVVDENGVPLPGVTVVAKGTTVGIVTSVDGNYSLTIPAGAEILIFSFVGMKTQEIVIGGQTIINVTLESETIGLDEVIAVGYASQKKANIVGSVTSVSGDKLESIPSSDVTNAISGRLPGSIVMQQTGEPGQNEARILVRGRTSLGDSDDEDRDVELSAPLVVVDGIPGRSLGDIDPVDIASITVLKDAAAAIYGASAANGVILVTTKTGTSGKPQLSYQFYQGFMTPTILPEVTNAGDYATMLSEYQDYEGSERTFSNEDIALYYSGVDPWEHPNTDWLGDLVATWNTVSKHNVSLNGGTNSGMTYYVSFGYKNEEAIYKAESTNYKQYNIRAKLDVPINDWLSTSIYYAGFLNDKLYPTRSADDIYGQATRLVPTQWSYWPTGEPGPDIEYGDNPVVTSTLQTGYDDTKDYKNQLTFKGTITPSMVKGLTIQGAYTYDVINTYNKVFQKPWILYYANWDSAVRDANGYVTGMDLVPTERGVSAPELTEHYYRTIRKLSNFNFNYNRTFGEHEFTLFGAYEQQTQDYNEFEAFRQYYVSDVVETLDAGSDTDKDNGGTMTVYARKSWIGRFNYNYKGKYLAEVVFRRDGSLKFPKDSRWGNFPGFLLGWRASEENFWKENVAFINYFKLRASYGKMGMDPGDSFQYTNKYELASGVAMGTGKTIASIVKQSVVANPFITWEKQTTYNLGFDSQILNSLFHLNAEIFYSKRSDILAARNASVPDYTGLELPDENIAEVDNRGFEFEAGFHKKWNNDFGLDVTGNISYTHNEVVFMDEPERAVPWQVRTGHPYGATLLYNAIGVFADEAAVAAYPHWSTAKPGDVIFEDVSGDGEITSDDKILLDKTDAPEIFYGITVDLAYKNWHLSLLAQGQGTFYAMTDDDERRGEAGNYLQWQFDNRWTPDNTNTNVGRAFNRNDLYWAMNVNNSTYHYANMAYCRLKNAVVSYDIPKKLTEKVNISRVNVYFSGNNLFLIYAAQRNFDPEIANPMTYPAVKTFAIGAKVTF